MLPQEQNLGRGSCAVQGDSWTRWLHAVREMEFARAMQHVPLGRESTVLEIGCGVGLQLNLLRRRFERVFAIDPATVPDSRQGFALSVAEELPFRDQSFDLVISSSVIEHLTNRPRAMAEVRRVLRPGGFAVHIVPCRVWKFTSLVLNPVGYPMRVAEKWLARRKARKAGPAAGLPSTDPPPGFLRVLWRWFRPPIHGTFPSHLAECRSFGRKQWRQTFALPGLQPVAEVPLLFFTQFGFLRFHFTSARIWAAKHGFASTLAYIFQMAPGIPPIESTMASKNAVPSL